LFESLLKKGQGANQALLDAVLLGQAIAGLYSKGRPDAAAVHAALRKAEEKMYERSSKKVEDSRAVAVRLHSREAVQDPATRGISQLLLDEFVRRRLGAQCGADLRRLVAECVAEVKKTQFKQTD